MLAGFAAFSASLRPRETSSQFVFPTQKHIRLCKAVLRIASPCSSPGLPGCEILIHPTVQTSLRSHPWTLPFFFLTPPNPIHQQSPLPQATSCRFHESLYSLHGHLHCPIPPSPSDWTSSLCNVTLSPAMLATSNLALAFLCPWDEDKTIMRHLIGSLRDWTWDSSSALYWVTPLPAPSSHSRDTVSLPSLWRALSASLSQREMSPSPSPVISPVNLFFF